MGEGLVTFVILILMVMIIVKKCGGSYKARSGHNATNRFVRNTSIILISG